MARELSVKKDVVKKYIEVKSATDTYQLNIDASYTLQFAEDCELVTKANYDVKVVDKDLETFKLVLLSEDSTRKTLCTINKFDGIKGYQDYFGDVYFDTNPQDISDFDVIISKDPVSGISSEQINVVISSHRPVAKIGNIVQLNHYLDLIFWENLEAHTQINFRARGAMNQMAVFSTFSVKWDVLKITSCFVKERLANGDEYIYPISPGNEKVIKYRIQNSGHVQLQAFAVIEGKLVYGDVLQIGNEQCFEFEQSSTIPATGKFLSFTLGHIGINVCKTNVTLEFIGEDHYSTITLAVQFLEDNYYRNIIVPKQAQIVRFPDNFAFSEIKFQNERLRTNREQGLASNVIDSISFYEKPRTKRKKKLLVTFPGFSECGKMENQFPISFAKANDEPFYQSHFICFLDENSVKGTYMQYDDHFKPTTLRTVEILRKKIAELKLKEEDVVFFGASKGGSIASLYLEHFPKSTFVICVPQMDLDMYAIDRPDNVGVIMTEVNRESIDFVTKFDQKIINAVDSGVKIHMFLSSNDGSNSEKSLNYFDKGKSKIKNTHISYFDLPHGRVVKLRYDDIKLLLNKLLK